MDSILKKGLFLVTTAGAITAFPATAYAIDTDTEDVMPQTGIEEVLNNCYVADKEIEVEDYLVPTEKGEYLDMAFADVQSFLYIRSEPTTDSEWVGKLYPDYAAKILGPVGEWTKGESGETAQSRRHRKWCRSQKMIVRKRCLLTPSPRKRRRPGLLQRRRKQRREPRKRRRRRPERDRRS